MGQSTLIMFVVYFTLASLSPNPLGKLGSQQAAGNLVFIVAVLAVNLKVVVSSYQYSVVNITVLLLSDASAFVVLWGLSVARSDRVALFPDLLGNFRELFEFPETYTALVFCMFAFVLWDVGTERAGTEIRTWLRARRLAAADEQRREARQDKAVVRRMVTSYQNRGFAFSQAPGNDILVTDTLTDRMMMAFQRQMQASEMLHGLPGVGSPYPTINDGGSVTTDSVISTDSANKSAKSDAAGKGMGLFAILKRHSDAAGFDLSGANAKQGIPGPKGKDGEGALLRISEEAHAKDKASSSDEETDQLKNERGGD